MDWVAVGLCADVPAGTVVPRRVDGTDLAIWCSAAGVYHAWGDRCPHRGMRLSYGFVRGETLACIYHGWQYDDAGACAYIPAHPKLVPPKTICAQTHTCVAQDGMIWVALKPVTDAPPPSEGRVPVRSIDVGCPATDVAASLGAPLAPLMVLAGTHDLAFALQPMTQSTCFVHAFAGADQDLPLVSRHLEEMRTTLEVAA